MSQVNLKYTRFQKIINRKDINEIELAHLTHYLQHSSNGVGAWYKKIAERVLQKNKFFEYDKLQIEYDLPFPPVVNPKFSFVDLCAGIGGFRIALQNLKGQCVFSSEIDKYAQQTYEANFGEIPFGDIKQIDANDIPNHDILCAGFPCQSFSIAGKRKGFKDEIRGTIFFEIARILEEKKPKFFFLENVKGLRNHDKGNTLKTILSILRDELGYYVPDPKIINAKDYGVPQNRERIFIVGIREDLGISHFEYPKGTDQIASFGDVKEKEVVSVKYYLSTQYISTLKNHKNRHEKKGNGFGYAIIDDGSCANAIIVGGMGKERNIVIDNRLTDFTPVTKIKGEVNRDGWRRMTPREWARLQGFSDKFIIPVSDAQAYKQFGNSVAIPAIEATAKQLLKHMEKSNASRK